jgi:cytochrome c556
MIRRLLLLSMLAAAPALTATAATPDRAIGYRQDVFGLVGWNFGALADMVREKRAWDGAEFTRRAERVAQLSLMTDEGFPEGSDKGATTDAKPEIWTNRADFDAKMDDFRREAAALASTAKGGDQAAIKAQFAKTGGTCKACHDEYKAD